MTKIHIAEQTPVEEVVIGHVSIQLIFNAAVGLHQIYKPS